MPTEPRFDLSLVGISLVDVWVIQYLPDAEYSDQQLFNSLNALRVRATLTDSREGAESTRCPSSRHHAPQKSTAERGASGPP